MVSTVAGVEPAEGGPAVVAALGFSRLRRRRFELIPLRGPGAAFTQAQGRQPGDAHTPEELSDLISSIAEIGVLQPILVEEIPAGGGPARLLTVAGERRLRSCRWGAVNLPDNPHFAAVPAIVCPGPLSEEERRRWQLIENLAREPLRPGEQAAALLFHRCAVLTGKLLRSGRPVPAEVYELDDPVARFAALERIRAGDPDSAAPWAEVLTRLGLQCTPRKARELVRAFAMLPRGLSEQMDEAKIRLHTRIRFAQLRQGRAAAAEEIWAAVTTSRRYDLLPAAVTASLTDPALEPGGALLAAQGVQDNANQARAQKLSRHVPSTPAGAGHTDGESEVGLPEADGAAGPDSVPAGVVRAAVDALCALRVEMRAGRRLGEFDRGSLSLVLEETSGLLAGAQP